MNAVAQGRDTGALLPAEVALQDVNREKALRFLDLAVIQGFDEWDSIRNETDFEAIRDDAKFKRILDREKINVKYADQYCGKPASITHSQTSAPMNVDSTTNTAGNALSLAGLLLEFMMRPIHSGRLPEQA